jgi:hypothetical protein
LHREFNTLHFTSRGRHRSSNDGLLLFKLVNSRYRCKKASPPVADKDADEPAVSMANRALPLIDLLAAAAKAESDAMWDESSIPS